VRWDERGFGRTEDDGKPFTYWDSAADAVGLLDALDVDRAVFAGMSQGGFLSLRAALAGPDRVRALVLLDTAADVDDEATLAAYQAMEQQWVSPDTSAEGHRALAEVIAGIIIGDPELAKPWVDGWEAEPRERLVESFACLVGREDITDRLSEIRCPALVVHGSADVAISVDRAAGLRDGLSGCRGFVVIDGGSHASNLTHPAEVNAAIAEFLGSL
jgi:pimeloyl-ACP methyl ester carboxylesterase